MCKYSIFYILSNLKITKVALHKFYQFARIIIYNTRVIKYFKLKKMQEGWRKRKYKNILGTC